VSRWIQRLASVALIILATTLFAAPAAKPRDALAERLYWEKLRQEKQKEQQAQQQHQSTERERVKASIAELAQQGAEIQPQIIEAEDGPPPPPPRPSILKGKGDYVVIGFVGVLLVGLAAMTLSRHREEAELRALCGGYLSDGTEVAKFQMPDWFATPAPVVREDLNLQPNEDGPVIAKPPEQVDKFFAESPEQLNALRDALKELSRIEEPEAAERPAVLLKMHTILTALAAKANIWDLRPAWQLSSALELLVKRVADKPKDYTASTLRTISSAIDTLHELCVPGVRPNLIIDPPIRILAVDDEPLCLRALEFALQKANLTADRATDGIEAVKLASEKPYDMIFMDIQMPEMDGLAACSNIRYSELNAKTPIVFVTVMSDFATRARTTAIGGNDFMAKPFLVFELTVKAMTTLMRRRLALVKSSRVMPLTEATLAASAQSVSRPAPVPAPVAAEPVPTEVSPAVQAA
jgi:CheY-like chemotaxis protein